jgi:hypothetical protein
MVLVLRGDALSTALSDAALLGLFAIDHRFAKRTGPYAR